MQIDFPLEFIVYGTPVSHQSKRPESREQWKTLVRAASNPEMPEGHFASDERMAVTMFYFPSEAMQGDVDNIVKLVLDACCAHVYLDDSQVERILVQKFEPDYVYGFDAPSETMKYALEGKRPALYVRVSNQPHEDLR